MKKFITLLLVLVLCMGLVPSAMAWDWKTEGTIFPLETPVTFTILTSGYRYADIADIKDNKDWQALCAATNVNIEFVDIGDYDAPETRSTLQMRLMGENYGDAILSVFVDTLSVVDINDLGSAGILIPVEEYLNNPEVMPNFYKNVASQKDYLMKNMTSDDGHIYSFYPIAETAVDTACEALLQVNEAWMESWKTARGVDHSPATIDEFEDMLLYFRDADFNGNNEKDEIPYMVAQPTYMGTATVEHVLGMYGISTKDSALDMNIMIDDDKCYFAHTTEAYKEGLKKLANWYAQDLIWKEAFTANAETINSKFAMATTAIGVVNTNVSMEGFVTIAPPAVEGYQARYHMHPAARSGLGQPYAVITNQCKNPEILASFLDLLYDYENYLGWRYGTQAYENGSLTMGEDGKYIFAVPANPPAEGEVDDKDRAVFDFLSEISAGTAEVIDQYVDMNTYFAGNDAVPGHVFFREEGYWNPSEKIWPRCAILPEYSEDFGFMLTDVSAVLTEYRAKFVTGQYDVDEKWDEFQNKMKKLGLEEMLEIVQKSYDAYLK